MNAQTHFVGVAGTICDSGFGPGVCSAFGAPRQSIEAPILRDTTIHCPPILAVAR
ncbi:hypothetical protein EV278_10882 [Caulobacter sp. BK020]|nr:hypothetical protein EV278_10882 [Caulobacter sp. BK020]